MTDEASQVTVGQYVINRLHDLSIRDVFGVPGDVAFPILDTIFDDGRLNWIANSNELNASYAADGYARINGAAALCTTYGVGELSALNGIAGAYAECNTLFHLVGMPAAAHGGAVMHHMLGAHDFDLYAKLAEPVYCATTQLTAENCIAETERVIAAALQHRRPVYIGIAFDVCTQTAVSSNQSLPEKDRSDADLLAKVVAEITDRISKAQQACVLPGIALARFGLRELATEVIEASGLPYATALLDKSVIDESHPAYMGMYLGLMANPAVQAFVEGCDCVLRLGSQSGHVNTWSGSIGVGEDVLIDIQPHFVQIGAIRYDNLDWKDVLTALLEKLEKRKDISAPLAVDLNGEPAANKDEAIDAGSELYALIGQFIHGDDILIIDPSSAVFGGMGMKLPAGARSETALQWGAIGWGTAAALGTAVAAPDKRTVLIAGEGSHQMTMQEIGQFYQHGLKPLIIIINNDGYQIERLTSRNPEEGYNDVTQWRYAELPAVLGCKDWLTARVTTWKELEDTLQQAESASSGVYIEVITDRYSMPPFGDMLFNGSRLKFGQPTNWDQWQASYNAD